MSETERIWRCSCGTAHFLTIRTWDDGDPPIFTLASGPAWVPTQDCDVLDGQP